MTYYYAITHYSNDISNSDRVTIRNYGIYSSKEKVKEQFNLIIKSFILEKISIHGGIIKGIFYEPSETIKKKAEKEFDHILENIEDVFVEETSAALIDVGQFEFVEFDKKLDHITISKGELDSSNLLTYSDTESNNEDYEYYI